MSIDNEALSKLALEKCPAGLFYELTDSINELDVSEIQRCLSLFINYEQSMNSEWQVLSHPDYYDLALSMAIQREISFTLACVTLMWDMFYEDHSDEQSRIEFMECYDDDYPIVVSGHRTTVYCPNGCNVTDVPIEYPYGECGACGQVMREDNSSFNESIEFVEEQAIAQFESENSLPF